MSRSLVPAPVTPTVGSRKRSPVGMRTPAHRVELRAIWWWTARAVIWTLVLAGGLGLAWLLRASWGPWVGPPFWVVLVTGLSVAVVMPTWRYQVHRWEITDETVYTRSGWFIRQWRVVPFSRIQSVDTVRGPLQQVLGICTVSVSTASRQGSVRIEGISTQTAVAAVDGLAGQTSRFPGDAT